MALATLTAVARAVFASFTQARCPKCKRRIMDIPGDVILEERMVNSEAERSGRGRVVSCRRCQKLVEIIEHGLRR